MIPRIIHYCWFGGKPLPDVAKKCIDSWRKFFPTYEIIEWNEKNYDVNKIAYTSEAYKEKKYAFVTDYARFDILYQYGGIYFDTDVEVIKCMDDIINNGAFFGLESGEFDDKNSKIRIASGLGIGVEEGNTLYKKILDFYQNIHFCDGDGNSNLTTVVDLVTDLMKSAGIKSKNRIGYCEGISIYPKEYFCPKDYFTGEFSITKNTYSIHHYSATWKTPFDRAMYKIKVNFVNRYGLKIGVRIAAFLCFPIRAINKVYKKTIKKVN